MIVQRQSSTPVAPIDFDAPCRRCNYNLRGLRGNPICCPECGLEHAPAELQSLHGLRARFRQLKGAGDAMLLGIIALAAGLYLLAIQGPFPLGLPILGGAGLLIFLSLSACGRIMPAHVDWHTPLLRYVGWTCTLGLVPLGIWAVFSLLTWRLTTTFTSIKAGAGVDAVHVLAAGAPTLIALYFLRPHRWIRWRQRRTFGRLMRILRGK